MAEESWRVPTPVQELAAVVVEPPNQLVLREQDRPGSLLLATDMPEPIPMIDLSRLPAADEAAKLQSALQGWGLFLVTNHGIEASLMDAVTGTSRDFFHLPHEEKQKCSNLIGGKSFQPEGYGNSLVLSQDQILDWHDRLLLRVEPEDERNLSYWPKEPESFRPELVFGVKPHSDGGVLTIVLVANDVAGLQVQRGGIWYNVPSKPHTLLVNLGDSMEIMNNGIFKSPVHRVVTNTEQERISVAMFYNVEGQKMLEPAAGLLDENRPARYRKIKASDFFVGLREHISKGKRFIETLKI
ncbi:unnamed protein product [Urochloa decumbens]|uniref:Fe2OG dioxygenase domain-containing protein n=1 Tax=Urochloa decumbens TaxID=240449 RepID=A0ABC9E5M0_9POAL